MTKSSSVETDNNSLTPPLPPLASPDEEKKAEQKSIEEYPDLPPFLRRGTRPLKKRRVADFSQDKLVSSDQILTGNARSEKKRQIETDLNRSQSEHLPLFDPPVIPFPEVDKSPPLECEKREIEQIGKDLELKKTSPFGLPFRHSSGSEIVLGCHPQMILAASLEDCTDTIITQRNYTTKTIVESDYVKREEINKEFEKKLRESLETAKNQQTLSYITDSLSFLNSTVGLVGGVSIISASLETGDGIGVLYGIEMTAGGVSAFGSFLLDKFGYENSTLSPLMALGGALLSFHGGFMRGVDSSIGSWSRCIFSAISLMRTCSLVKETQIKADLCRFSGEMTALKGAQKSLSDETRKHFGDLGVHIVNVLFKVAIETDEALNQLSKKIVQSTLKG